MATPIRPSAIHQPIFRWYSTFQRPFPWRKTRDPYRILLSEMMSQQTQVARVAEYYPRWLKQFPTIGAFAHASTADVLRAWSGLGYNSRALRFHRLAKSVVANHRSRIPSAEEDLLALPGIGRYTASALRCFAFGISTAVVDVNIRRILTRWTGRVRTASDMLPEREAWSAAEHFLPKKHSYRWNQALMDLGALVCTARNPTCAECPVSSHCASAFSKQFFVREKKKRSTEPVWRGTPRRLYRGKILKLLHHRRLDPAAVASLLWKDATVRDVEWAETVLITMAGDGLLSVRSGRYGLAS